MKFKSIIQTLAVLLVAFSVSLPALGQAVNFAQMQGRVVDPSGAAIAGATIKAEQPETGLVRTTVSAPDGHYVLPTLPIGNYVLTVTKSGFAEYVRKGIALSVSDQPTIDIALKLGAATELVEVVANAAMVETHENSITSLIDNSRILEMPLNGRNLPDLIMLSGGASDAPVTSQDINSTKNYGNNQSGSTKPVSVGGSQENSNNFLLDGSDHNDSFSNVNAPFPFPDAIQEFSVNSSGLSARYGVHSGATVNAITKSGTNNWHGSAFDFIRNPEVNAKHWVSQPLAAGQKDDSQQRNQFGGTLGGAIVKDQLLFFTGYQGTRFKQTLTPVAVIVPTAAALQGDFSTMFGGATQPNGKKCASKTLTGTWNGYTFAGNKIDPRAFNASATQLAGLLPTAVDACGNATLLIPNIFDEDQGITKVDWNISSKHQIFSRYFITDSRSPVTYDGKNVLTQGQGTSSSQFGRFQSLAIGDNFTFTPTLLNAFHFTATRRAINRTPASNMITPASIGIADLDAAAQTGISQPIDTGMVLNVNSYFTVGGGSNMPGHFINNLLQVADDMDWIHGKHQVSWGVNFMRMQLNYLSTYQSNGQFTFNGKYSGDNLADFLVGRMSNYIQGNDEAENWRYSYFGLYLQDAYKVTPKLLFNIGLRWEPYLPSGDALGRGSHFDINAFKNNIHSTVYPNAPAGLQYCGDPGVPCKYANKQWKQFEPRVGFVLDPRGKGAETLRASYGLFYDSPELYYFDRYADNSPFGSGVSFTPDWAHGGNINNPWKNQAAAIAYPQAFPKPGVLPSSYFPTKGVYINNDFDVHPMYTQNWNLSVEKQFPKDWLVSASYVGTKTTHIWVAYEANPGMPQNVPANALAGCTANQAPSTSNIDCRRALYVLNPSQGQYFSNLTSLWDGANSEYNALLLTARHRFAQHYTLLTNYNWSHCISDQDFSGELTNSRPDLFPSPITNPNFKALKGDRGDCAFDIRHSFNTSLVVTSPKMAGAMGLLFSNWQLAPMAKYRTGQALTITTGSDSAMIGATTSTKDRPNATGIDPFSGKCSGNGATVGSYLCYFNPAAYTTTGLGAGIFGNVGRNSLRGPGAINFDASVSRAFQVQEHKELTFRLEIFNVLNHPNLGNPTTQLSNAKFGQITAQNGDPRVMQGALKFTF